jgi:Glyoxalase-like domain
MAIKGLDHIIYGSPDLERAIEEVRLLTGVEPIRGGTHPGRGTQNALLSLGPHTYIEILAPDPAQSPEALALAAERIPASNRIINWAAKCDDLEVAFRMTAGSDLNLGRIEDMSRALPSGGQLAWRLTRGALVCNGLVPFLIDWDESPHPAMSSPSGCALQYFRAEHPDPALVKDHLASLGLQDVLEVSRGPQPRMLAGLSTPNGDVVLN